MRIVVLLVIVLLLTSCSGSPESTSNINSSPAPTASSPSPSPLSDFEEALRYVRNGQFTYIWVISRKDGKPLQPADSTFLKTNAPQVVDWLATKDKTKVVAGTNFNLEEGNLEVLKKRFVMEDYSAK